MEKRPPLHLGVVAIEKGAFTYFTYFLLTMQIYYCFIIIKSVE